MTRAEIAAFVRDAMAHAGYPEPGRHADAMMAALGRSAARLGLDVSAFRPSVRDGEIRFEAECDGRPVTLGRTL